MATLTVTIDAEGIAAIDLVDAILRELQWARTDLARGTANGYLHHEHLTRGTWDAQFMSHDVAATCDKCGDALTVGQHGVYVDSTDGDCCSHDNGSHEVNGSNMPPNRDDETYAIERQAPMRCMYSDCAEQHPVAVETEQVTCPKCRECLSLPPLDKDSAK